MLSRSGPVPSSLHHSWCCWTLILAPEWVRAVCNNPFGACLGTQMTFQHRQAPAVRAGAGLGEQYCLHGCQDARFFFLEIASFRLLACFVCNLSCIFFSGLFFLVKVALFFLFLRKVRSDFVAHFAHGVLFCFLWRKKKCFQVSENTSVQGKVAWAQHGRPCHRRR